MSRQYQVCRRTHPRRRCVEGSAARADMTSMRGVRPIVSALSVVLMASSLTACAGRTTRARPSAHVEPTELRDRRRLDEIAAGQRAGRLTDALKAYRDVAAESRHAAVVREALLQAALTRLMLYDDLPEAQQMLREARTLHPAGEEPSALMATMRLVERLIAAEGAASSSARERAALHDELRTARRTMAALKQQLEKRDDALKKAAQAAVGPARQD